MNALKGTPNGCKEKDHEKYQTESQKLLDTLSKKTEQESSKRNSSQVKDGK